MQQRDIQRMQNCPVKCPKDLTKKVFVKDDQNYRLLFTLGKAGEALWRNAIPGDVLSSYNPLFDPNLKDFFRRRGIRLHLLKSNLVTVKNEILCSLKDYNDYRQSLFRVNADHQRARYKSNDSKEVIQKRIKISDDIYKKIEIKNKKFVETYGDTGKTEKCLKENPIKYETLVRNLKGKKLERECQLRKKYLKDVKKYNERIQKINYMNRIKRNELTERGLHRNMEIIKKQIFAIEKRREFESKTNQKICKRFEGFEKRRRVFVKPEKDTLIIKCISNH